MTSRQPFSSRVWTALLLIALTSATAQTAPTVNDRYTPVVQSVPSPPHWFRGTDGQVHLADELVLTNAFPVPVTFTSVEVLARTGNSGSSSGPHRHFHVTDAPSALAADGLPYAFDAFSVTGRTPPLEALLEGDRQAPVPVNTQDASLQRDALLLGRAVMTFTQKTNR